MTSLKEEIEDIVRNTRVFTSPKITNMILEKIEKRLDYYIEEADGKEEEVDLLNIMKEELLK